MPPTPPEKWTTELKNLALAALGAFAVQAALLLLNDLLVFIPHVIQVLTSIGGGYATIKVANLNS